MWSTISTITIGLQMGEQAETRCGKLTEVSMVKIQTYLTLMSFCTDSSFFF